MPLYLSSSSNTQSTNIGTLTLQPGQQGTSYEFFTTAQLAGVNWSLVSSSPSYNPIIYGALITSTGSYTIPVTLLSNYRITIFVSASSSGSIAVQPNGAGNVETLVGGQSYSVDCYTRIVNSVSWTVTGTIAATISVTQI